MTAAARLRTLAMLARARERVTRLLHLDVAAELRRVREQATEAERLEALAAFQERIASREARRGGTATARRLELLDWLDAIDRGKDPGSLGRFAAGAGRRALNATGGNRAAAAARLTGEPLDAFANAQREGSRRPRVRRR